MKRILSTGIATTIIALVGGGISQLGMAAGFFLRLGNGLFAFLGHLGLGATLSKDITLGITLLDSLALTGRSVDGCANRGIHTFSGAGLGQDFRRDFVPLG